MGEDGSSEAETNRQLVLDAFERWTEGSAPISDLFADDMRWRVEGNSMAAREYADKATFLGELLGPFGERFAHGERFRPVVIRHVLADADTVAVIWDGTGVANDGVRYDNSYAWILQMRDGAVVDATAFFDSIAFDRLWTRLAP
ncbi:nuclear transport factor 2 family protein [Dermatobacter hominis]|uniref:nuclear transport factor 2 family protein n=1 Tax=Dermatobacter hominis TaxID=2884263 RepID=UPI001D0FCEC6|nr:nuclear transport factor 2 family protein [Dermatobacter hominis]UDY34509.1 nuclear transport factor 2 family protein [Dermatobacter hominis]